MHDKRDRRTVEGDWFGSAGFTGLDYNHLEAFPRGVYAATLITIALEWMSEDALKGSNQCPTTN